MAFHWRVAGGPLLDADLVFAPSVYVCVCVGGGGGCGCGADVLFFSEHHKHVQEIMFFKYHGL